MELNWSRWSRCESSFGLLLVPNQPGVFTLAEEIMQPMDPQARRMLAIFEIAEADDLVRALSRLFTPASPWRERLATGRCYMRYAVVPNRQERGAAATALKAWLHSQREAAAQVFDLDLGEITRRAAKSEATTEAERAVDRVTARH